MMPRQIVMYYIILQRLSVLYSVLGTQLDIELKSMLVRGGGASCLTRFVWVSNRQNYITVQFWSTGGLLAIYILYIPKKARNKWTRPEWDQSCHVSSPFSIEKNLSTRSILYSLGSFLFLFSFLPPKKFHFEFFFSSNTHEKTNDYSFVVPSQNPVSP